MNIYIYIYRAIRANPSNAATEEDTNLRGRRSLHRVNLNP